MPPVVKRPDRWRAFLVRRRPCRVNCDPVMVGPAGGVDKSRTASLDFGLTDTWSMVEEQLRPVGDDR